MDIEREIELLKEKVKLLEAVRDLQEKIKVAERPAECPTPYIPYTPPVYPSPVFPTAPWYDPFYAPYRWTGTTDRIFINT
jgi:hypothetical protein